MLSDGVYIYTYDSANRLTGLSKDGAAVTYGYNGLGDRLKQTINGDERDFSLDLNAGLTQVLAYGGDTYLYGLNRLGYDNSGETYQYLADALGSVRQVTKSGVTNAGLTLSKSYDPYGNVIYSNGAETSYGFTGEWQDNSLNGMIYLRARSYNPTTGTFLSKDSWDGDVNTPMSYNKWSYVNDNPVDYTDPTGQHPCTNECGARSNTPTWQLVTLGLSPDKPQAWTEDEKAVVEEQAQLSADRYASAINKYRRAENFWALKECGNIIYKSLVTPTEAFVRIHKGRVNFLRSGATPGNAGYTTDSNLITIYSIRGINEYIVIHPKLITHELGHAFDIGTKGNVYSGFSGDLMRAGDHGHKDPNGGWFGFAGGWENWQYGWANSSSEIFADMYIGWIYGSWDIQDINDPNDLGTKRKDYMGTIMTQVLATYTEDIP